MRAIVPRHLAGSIVHEARDDTADAVFGRLSARTFRPSNDFEHLSIVLEYIRDELSNTAGTRNTHELLQEQGGCAAILIVVCNRDRELRALAARRDPDEAANRDQPFAGFVLHGENQSDVAAEIQLGELSKHVRCERRNRVKEPSVDASRRQSLERDSQPFLVVGAYRAEVNRSSVAEQGAGMNRRRLRMPPNEDSREDSFDRAQYSAAWALAVNRLRPRRRVNWDTE
jgi:hypothetical protein